MRCHLQASVANHGQVNDDETYIALDEHCAKIKNIMELNHLHVGN